jgi:LPS O-antigen subunit length determinant protein (WzzB/FepE family)
MKKKFTSYKNSSDNYEVDIIDTIILLWNKKIKIIIITFFSFLIASTYNYQLLTKFEISLPIKPSSDFELLRLKYIYLNIDNHEQGKINKIIFDRFIAEAMDYDELMLSIKNQKKIDEQIYELSKEKKKLLSNSRILTIDKKKENQIILRLIWDNADEAKNILENTLTLTLNNLKKSIFAEVEKSLLLKKKQIQIKDLEKIEFLLEQSSIAKEFDIVENKDASRLFKFDSLSKINEFLIPPTKIHEYLVPYYLRGYKVIEKEIDILKNRKHSTFEFIEKEIAFLKEFEINWVDYDINLLNTKQFKDSKLDLLISTLCGLFIAIFYVIFEKLLKIRLLIKS